MKILNLVSKIYENLSKILIQTLVLRFYFTKFSSFFLTCINCIHSSTSDPCEPSTSNQKEQTLPIYIIHYSNSILSSNFSNPKLICFLQIHSFDCSLNLHSCINFNMSYLHLSFLIFLCFGAISCSGERLRWVKVK